MNLVHPFNPTNPVHPLDPLHAPALVDVGPEHASFILVGLAIVESDGILEAVRDDDVHKLGRVERDAVDGPKRGEQQVALWDYRSDKGQRSEISGWWYN